MRPGKLVFSLAIGLGIATATADDAARHHSSALNPLLYTAAEEVPDGLKVLFVGNSITLHKPCPEVGWTNDCGMAASAAKNDYVHLVARGIARRTGRRTSLRIANIAYYERHYRDAGFLTNLAEEVSFKPDVIVLALGENAPDLRTAQDRNDFRSSVVRLLRRLSAECAQPPKVVVRGVWWANEAKDAALAAAAKDCGVPFVKADVASLGGMDARGAGFAHAGVASHPGDRGMAEIAARILGALYPPGDRGAAAVGVRDRVTCLEAWGRRRMHDFTREGAELVKRAGFTGVFLNGASGFGPDQISLALAGETKALPRLAPYTCRANDRELHERAAVLDAAKLDKWWCLWGIPGPHMVTTDANLIYRTLDWRMKAEMKAELERNPEIFGKRVPGKGSWRGSRPLCLSHPHVRAFYREAWRNAVREYGLKGLVFFPGDDDPECCDETCERCRAGGKDGFALLIALANEMMEIARGIRADFEMDFVVWNNGHGRLDRFLKELDPRIGIAMSHSDQLTVPRAAGEIWYNQPWANFGAKGDRFAAMAKRARAAGRPVMSIGEIAQSEVWDPLHNMPNPRETIRLLRGAAEENAAVMDFWGERRPFTPHANFAAMRAYLADPAADDQALLDRAARDHYAIAEGDGETLRLAREAWTAFERADRSSSLVTWTQRFSPGIGRNRARGRLFCALTPALFAEIEGKGYRCWPYRQVAAAVTNTEQFLSVARGDRERFGAAADAFARLADRLEAKGDRANVANARSEGDNVRLAGELYGSEARTIAAVQAYERKDAAALRALIGEELEARERELRISARLDPESGIDPLLVQEDLANMRLYLSSDGFPSVPKDRFLMNDVWYR